MKRIIYCTLIIFIFSCTQEETGNLQIEITRNSFPVSLQLTGEKISFVEDSIKNAILCHVIMDSILIVESRVANPFYMQMYNLKTKKKIFEFARRGNGPNEFLSAGFLSNAYNPSIPGIIYIYDVVKSSLTEYDIHSLLQNRQWYKPKQIKFPQLIDNLAKLDSTHYVCFNDFFLNDKKINNNVPCLFSYDIVSKKPDRMEYKYFVPNVTGGKVLISPVNDNIIIPFRREDRIEVYNKNLEHLRTLVGPDMLKPEYRIRDENHISFVPGKRTGAYTQCCFTNNSVYLLYSGLTREEYDNYRNIPVEVFKIDWDANLICRYQLDRYIMALSVSSDNKFLYGNYLNENGETGLVRYALNN